MNANTIKFNQELASAYVKLFEKPEYAFVAASKTPQELADKMTSAFIEGSASNDGDGIKMACKACGIKTTYKAINTYLKGE